MNLLSILSWFSALSFVFFGLNCLFSKYIKLEFERYNLPNYRKLTGVLQLIGATGLIVGHYYTPLLLLVAAIGLSLLMFLGFGVRLKVKDNFAKSSPALIFALLNFYIALKTYMQYFQ